jgi:reversibly glycosylated polypeptide/UDP-arabinopyranose mutase
MPAYNAHLVVPTNRPENLKGFLEHWVGCGNCWEAIHVVFDMEAVKPELFPPKKIFDTQIFCYSWADMQPGHPFSKRDSAVRSFGFYQAYRAGAEYIVTVDDDCMLDSGVPFTFMYHHLTNLNGTPKWASTVPGEHVRGLPFKNKGLMKCDVSMGLWTDVPDLSAPVQLTRSMECRPIEIKLPKGARVMPSHQFAPMCGMNLAFTRRATPLMYFAPMGAGQPYARFDDIWCGLVAQRVMAHLGWSWVVGEPFVRHSRASDPIANLVKEAPGIKANEEYWKVIEGIELKSNDPLLAVREAGQFLSESGWSDDYMKKWGRSLTRWCDLF